MMCWRRQTRLSDYENVEGSAKCAPPFFGTECYLLEPACMPSPESPSSSANFLPANRAPERVLVPSLFLITTAALFADGEFRSTTFACTLASTFLPCMMLTSTLGPLPSHSNLYSPALSLVPLIVVGLCKFKLAFVTANALEANSKANPITTLLEIVENVIAAPFFFPEYTSGSG